MQTPTKTAFGSEGSYSPASEAESRYSSTSCPPYHGGGGSGNQPDVPSHSSPPSGSNCPCPCDYDVPPSILNPNSQEKETDSNESPENFQADPVDVYSGAHTISVNLMNLFAGQKLSLTAHYNSSRLTKGVMGYGWYHNFEKRLEIIGAVSEIRIYESPSQYERYDSCNSGRMGVGTLPRK